MKMPKYEKLRNRATRLSTSTPPSSRRTTWDYLNANFTIWLLTAVVGSVITLAYSNLQACNRAANEKIERFALLKWELLARTASYSSYVIAAHNTQELAYYQSAHKSLLSKFKDENIADLIAEAVSIATRTAFDRDLFASKFQANAPTKEELALLSYLFAELSPTQLPNVSFKQLKILADKMLHLAEYVRQLDRTFVLVPYCEASNAFLSLLAPQPYLLQIIAKPDPLKGWNIPIWNERPPTKKDPTIPNPK